MRRRSVGYPERIEEVDLPQTGTHDVGDSQQVLELTRPSLS